MKLDYQEAWRGSHKGVYFKVVLWNKGADHTPGGGGIWNCYIYIPEKRAVNFAKLWLEDNRFRFSPESPERIQHDYSRLPIEMHGGLTYYAKHGHPEGHRCVEVGCDYNHLWDMERGGGYTAEYVAHDAVEAIDKMIADEILSDQPSP